jgi:bifunctional DNA primase/polymerase-like protein
LTPDTTYAPPYGRAARLYRAAGWRGVLPIGKQPRKKYPPPLAYTGHGKPDPSGADIEAWLDGPEADRNIGLRLPAGVLGLDVDAYGGKQGGARLDELTAQYGPLPPTWISSAREGVSGIRFYRVPTVIDGHEINWPGEAAKHIELIQHGHRYAVVWPSINPEAGDATYEWRRDDLPPGHPTDPVPRIDGLPWLPESWVRGLMLPYARTDKATLGSGDLAAYWEGLRTGGERCPVVQGVLDRGLADLRSTDGSRHETARDTVRALVALGGEGHRGVQTAVEQVSRLFAEAVGPERIANGEWHRLLVGGIKLAAAKNPAPRQSCPDDAATVVPAHMVPEGFTSPAPTTISPATPAQVDVPAGGLTLPDEFWNARETLRRIRQAAHSKVRSADVVFYGALVRIAAMAPHTLRADTGIGTAASLNLFSAIVGPSGGGKSSGLSVGRMLVKETRPIDEQPLGSGEGIAEAYMGEMMEPTGDMAKDGSAKLAKVRKMVRHNVLFHSDEGATLVKLLERAGSTIGETLRSAWSGETIGQKNGRVETTRTVPAGTYACGLVIGWQPSTILPLLDDHEAGTPQRFLFCWAVDESIPPRSARVLWPGEMLSPFPEGVPTSLPPPGQIIAAPAPPMMGESIVFAEAITDELYDTEHAKNTGSLPLEHPLRDPFRSQHPVLKVKVAALLALLEGRRNVTLDDWHLAQIVIDTSDRVRIYLQALAAGKAAAAREAAERNEHALEWHREHARASVRETVETAADRRLATRVAVWVHEDGPATLGALRKRSAGRDRPNVEAAIELAVVAGWLAYEQDPTGATGRVMPGPSRPTM